MTDAGYSSEYEVYLTHRNGMQIVTNELSLQCAQHGANLEGESPLRA